LRRRLNISEDDARAITRYLTRGRGSNSDS
jgi:hypothetical protein